MKFLGGLAGLAVIAAATDISAPLVGTDSGIKRIPTSYESAVMGRRILGLTKLATFSTVFPAATNGKDVVDAQFSRPAELDGLPIGLMDYIADCEDEGNPTILAMRIGTTFRNVKAGSNITVSLQWTPPYAPSKRISFMSRLTAYLPFIGGQGPYNRPLYSGNDTPDTVPYSAANLPRFSLMGYLENVNADEQTSKKLATCYTDKHQDAKYWLPGNKIHTSEWARMVVTHIYWIGGFGDRAYIGWIPIEEWKKVTKDEQDAIRLPGEKQGWNEWSIEASSEL